MDKMNGLNSTFLKPMSFYFTNYIYRPIFILVLKPYHILITKLKNKQTILNHTIYFTH